MAANPRSRVIRTSNKSKASLFLTDSSAALVGDSRHFVVADERGVTIKGPISLVTDASGIRTGGLFVGLNDFLYMIPSTIVTPIPAKVPYPPITVAVNMTQDLAFFKAMLV
jgi:hypothetical protein